MNIEELRAYLTWCWDKDTCSQGQRENWTSENQTLGQCAITSLIVNDYFGGNIMRCIMPSGNHYFIEIDGNIIDLTVEQFQGEIPDYEHAEVRTREYLLSNPDTAHRYNLLNNRLQLIMEEDKKVIEKDVISNDFSGYYAYLKGKGLVLRREIK
jgi:hypothetical protein